MSDVLPAAETRVQKPLLPQLFKRLLIVFQMVRLTPYRLLPCQPKPTYIFHNSLLKLWPGPR